MNPPSGLTGSRLREQTATTKPNRLSRSFRLSQQTQKADSPQSKQADFKTPTRVLRSRAGGVFSGESPHNDSDIQQDIIWDATSPSPSRYGKRGKKQRAAVVDISEIVNRIAPKHGRPEAAEPTLQQWIGDSAAIPCTPDVQAPKRKSPRPNGVDNLLKLARQFDLNMFHQDEEEEVEEGHQQSLELLPDDIFEFETDRQPAVKSETDAAKQVDQHTVDDLDFLFDGPTQHVIGSLSQTTSQVKPASGSFSKEASGKLSSGVFTTTKKDELEDDWENDDLLNDSLVLEMTQNPQNFVAPKYCSTQKPSSEVRPQNPVKVPISGGLGQSAASKVDADNMRHRTTFKLESNPNFSVKRILTDTWTNSETKDSQQSRFSSSKSVSVKAGSQRTWQLSKALKSDAQRQFHPSVDGSSAKLNSIASTSQRFSSHSKTPAVSDLPDDDLHALFSSDPVWDNLADDDLFCEMCDDLENQIQRAENVCSTKQTALQPTNRQPFSQTVLPCASARPAALRGPQAESTSGSTNSSTCVQGNTNKKQFAFKKPNHPVTTATSKVLGKCSAAEIELKKQQAMERRRQRLQAAQNLRAPT